MEIKNFLLGYIEYDIMHLEGTTLENDNAGCTRYGLNTKDDGFGCEKLANMTIDEAINIYYEKLNPVFEDIYNKTNSIKLSLMYLDTVNLQGKGVANLCLKYAMEGLSEEDKINRYTARRIINLYLISQENQTLSQYLTGWFNRVMKMYMYIAGV